MSERVKVAMAKRKPQKPTTKKGGKRRRTQMRADWRPAFLASLSLVGNVTEAARAAKIDRSAAYDERKRDKQFAQAWDDAMDMAADELELEARRRAYEGVDEPVFGSLGGSSGSGEIGTIRRYSDTLLIFLLKGARPEKYRESYNVNHAGRVDSTVNVPQLDAAILKIYGNNATG